MPPTAQQACSMAPTSKQSATGVNVLERYTNPTSLVLTTFRGVLRSTLRLTPTLTAPTVQTHRRSRAETLSSAPNWTRRISVTPPALRFFNPQKIGRAHV